MLNNIFSSIIQNGTFTGTQFATATLTSLICGLVIAVTYSIKNKWSASDLHQEEVRR